jgi:hypothetical protein
LDEPEPLLAPRVRFLPLDDADERGFEPLPFEPLVDRDEPLLLRRVPDEPEEPEEPEPVERDDELDDRADLSSLSDLAPAPRVNRPVLSRGSSSSSSRPSPESLSESESSSSSESGAMS